VHRRPRAELPEAGVGLVVHGEGAVAHRLQGVEVLHRAGAQQPLVEEGLDQRQDDLAVDVVLVVLVRLVADAHRAHAAIARQGLGDALADGGLQPHAVDRLHLARRRLVDEVAQVAEVVLQHVRRAQPVQRADHVVGVADPAVAVVPVAPRPGASAARW
jgi:hypothetical protein